MTGDPEPPLRLVTSKIALSVLVNMSQDQFADLVKAVVDVTRAHMVIGGELHSDEEAFLLETGSNQADLWASTSTPTATAPTTGWNTTP